MTIDEKQHAEAAKNAGAAPLPDSIKAGMQVVSKIMTRTSYYL